MDLKSIHQSKDLFRGAFILTIAAFITKILSAVYRVPFQNIVGDVGFYIYQQIYPFYGMAVVLSTTGFPVVISKLYAEVKGRKEPGGELRLLLISFMVLQLFGFLCFLILYIGAGQIAVWMHDPKLAVILKVVSFVFLLFPIISLLRGYYQGKGNMVPTAVSQVGEQSVRVVTILLMAFLFTKKGSSLYQIGGGAMFGSITGSLVSVMILFIFLWSRKEWKEITGNNMNLHSVAKESRFVIKAFIVQGFAICISSMLMIFLQMADSLNLYSSLVASGMDQEAAKRLKGIYDRGQPLIQLGTVLATSMSLSLVPLITSERLKKKPEFLTHKIKLSLQVSLVFGIGASAGLWAIITPTNTMLFKNSSGSDVLGVLGLVILFSAIISTVIAVMQGMGKLMFPAIMIAMAFPLKYTFNHLWVPVMGTMGAAVSTVITLVMISLVLSAGLKKQLSFPLFTRRFWQTIAISGLAMVLFLKGYLFLTSGVFNHLFSSLRASSALEALSAVFLGGLLYLWLVLRGRVFTAEDLSLFPLGSKLMLFLPQEVRSRENEKEN